MLANLTDWGLSDVIVVGLITLASSTLAAWLGRRSGRERDADVLATLEPIATRIVDRLERENTELRDRIHELEQQIPD